MLHFTRQKVLMSYRLTTLAWGSDDVIAGGSEKGELELYNVSRILDHEEDCVVFRTSKRVKALDFSRIESNYLASVGNDASKKIQNIKT